MNVTILIIAILIGIFIVYYTSRETFATNVERDSAHEHYFKNNSDPNFEEYRNVVPDGNIVDYTKYKKIYGTKK